MKRCFKFLILGLRIPPTFTIGRSCIEDAFSAAGGLQQVSPLLTLQRSHSYYVVPRKHENVKSHEYVRLIRYAKPD